MTVKSNLEPHEAPVHQLADLVSRIVAIEGPIHTEEVARRISSAFGLSRTGKRIADAAARAIKAAMARDTVLKKKGAFLMTAEQMATPPVRDRSMESGNILKAQYLSPSEIAAAAQMVLAESGDVPRDDLIRAVGRLLGFQRVGPDLNDAISAALPH